MEGSPPFLAPVAVDGKKMAKTEVLFGTAIQAAGAILALEQPLAKFFRKKNLILLAAVI